jgi:hypothetical protein
VVARLHVGDALADRLDDACAFVSQDDGEGAFGVFAAEGICIWERGVSVGRLARGDVAWFGRGGIGLVVVVVVRTCVADSGVVDPDMIVSFWRGFFSLIVCQGGGATHSMRTSFARGGST